MFNIRIMLKQRNGDICKSYFEAIVIGDTPEATAKSKQ